MTYTRDEWEPASQEAAKIAEDKLRGRLIETMIISERRRRLNCLRQNQIAELREKLSESQDSYKSCVEFQQKCSDDWKEERDELREKLAAAKLAIKQMEPRVAFGEQCWQDQCENAYVEHTIHNRVKRERDRLRERVAELEGRGNAT